MTVKELCDVIPIKLRRITSTIRDKITGKMSTKSCTDHPTILVQGVDKSKSTACMLSCHSSTSILKVNEIHLSRNQYSDTEGQE